MLYWDPGHPFRSRTWIRTNLPYFPVNRGFAAKGAHCDAVGGVHWWYKRDKESSGCYHCKVVRLGQL